MGCAGARRPAGRAVSTPKVLGRASQGQPHCGPGSPNPHSGPSPSPAPLPVGPAPPATGPHPVHSHQPSTRFPRAQRPPRAPPRSRCLQARQALGGGAGAGRALRADGAPARLLLCVSPLFFHLFLKNSFIEIGFTHHRARPCEACSSVGFIQVASSHHHTDSEHSYLLRREPRTPFAIALRPCPLPPPAAAALLSAPGAVLARTVMRVAACVWSSVTGFTPRARFFLFPLLPHQGM